MARGAGLRKGLTLGLAAGVGVAVLRAARARREAQPVAAPPTWPPLPTAVTSEPPVATTAAADAGPADRIEPAPASQGTTVVAEAAVPAGVADATEADQEAVQGATGQAAPAAADEDLEAIIRAEEAALEAERLEAEQLELARLERARIAGDEDADGRDRREREREEALARFAAQREEAQALLALQEEREAKAVDEAREADHREPTIVGDLPTGPVDEPGAEPVDEVWPQDVTDLEPAVHLVEDDESGEPILEPVVPDEAVADLEEEPAWGAAVEPEPEPAWAAASLGDGRHDGAAGDGEVGPAADLDEGADLAGADGDDLEEDPRRPLMVADLDSGLGEGAPFRPPPDEEPAEPLSAWPAPPAEDWVDHGDEDDEDDDEGQLAPAAAVPEWQPADEGERPRRPIMTSAFDDDDDDEADAASAELEDADGEQAPAPRPRRRSGQPRVPLKARRLPADVGDDALVDDELPVAPAEAPAPQPAPPAEPVWHAAAAALEDAEPDVPAPIAATPGTRPVAERPPPPAKVAKGGGAAKKATGKKAPGKKAAATTAKAPASTRISSRRKKPEVLWVEPVGGSCPPGYPVKASLSSGIFHVVGGLFYERTRPDRCYRSPEAATADGLRQAKR